MNSPSDTVARTAEEKSCWWPCTCGHPAKDHSDDGNGGFAACGHDDCDCCQWYVPDNREESAEQYP